MKRTKTNNVKKVNLPDLINHSHCSDFTQIPNELIRNPEISGKAKAILCLLLSNKEGWKSYITAITKMMKEGESAIKSSLTELEEFGYLIRIRYRCKKTKCYKGSVWAYTDTPHHFKNIQKTIDLLRFIKMEPQYGNLQVDNLQVDNLQVGNQGLIIYNNKNTKKDKNIERKVSSDVSGSITISLFDKFWELYPRKVNKGKALTVWKKLCNNKKDRPKWKLIKRALQKQIKSEQWKDPLFIPHPTTWLNQSRWLDDPKYMTGSRQTNNNSIDSRKPSQIIEALNASDYQIVKLTKLLKAITSYFKIEEKETSIKLSQLYREIVSNQNKDADNIPEPAYLIDEYFYWLKLNDWIINVSPHVFEFKSKLFNNFIKAYYEEHYYNPITGR